MIQSTPSPIPSCNRPPMQLILIRHGETAWTRERRYQGSSDIPLTARGREQARLVAKRTKRFGLDAIYTSSLERARETGREIAKTVHLQPKADKRLNELSFGAWEGKTGEELMKEKDRAYRKWCEGRYVTPPKGEPLSHFRARVRDFLSATLTKHPGQCIALVAHGGTLKILMFLALKLPFRSFWTFRLDPASISILDFYPHFAQLVLLNDKGHLR